VEELGFRLMEVVAPLVRDIEFDLDGANHVPHLYSHITLILYIFYGWRGGVGRLSLVV